MRAPERRGLKTAVRSNGICAGLGRRSRLALDRDQQQRSGKIIRLNEKTVTLLSNGQKWRVGYGLLHHIVDSSAGPSCEPDQFNLLE